PAVCDAYEIGGEAHLAILYMDALDNFGKPTKTFTPQPKFPAITRDIAIIVDESVPAAAIIAEIKAAGGKHLCETRLFDVYRGANIPPNHKSVALRMTFRAEDRTLTDQDADRPIKKILAALTTAHAAQLRE
ncbi:MAG: phenylalanine--tRNA ligase subunit beta, partial [Defluviitaleaceae bacterium]|nr:phenylalanine--tRNA ligase subunit beta [Defluviitaleaceae bacterium]